MYASSLKVSLALCLLDLSLLCAAGSLRRTVLSKVFARLKMSSTLVAMSRGATMKMYRTLVAQSELSTVKVSRWFVRMRSQSLVALSRNLVALYKLWPKM